MAAVYLIRHCEPELRGVFLGQMDSPLSKGGKEHAAKALSKIEVAVAWCSPLLRARQTAEYIESARRTVLAELSEIDYGKWTGKTWAEVETEWSEAARMKSADWLGVAAPAGESWASLLNRAAVAWGRIRNGPALAAVVAHQAVNAALANLIDGRDPLQFAQQYGEVIRVEFD